MSNSASDVSQNMSQPAPIPDSFPSQSQAAGTPLRPTPAAPTPSRGSTVSKDRSRGATAVAGDLAKLDTALDALFALGEHSDVADLRYIDPSYVDPNLGATQKYRTNISFWTRAGQQSVVARFVEGTDTSTFVPSAAYSSAQAEAKTMVANPGTSLRGVGPSDAAAANGAMAARGVNELARVNSSMTWPLATLIYCLAAYEPVDRARRALAASDALYNAGPLTVDDGHDCNAVTVAYMTQAEYAEYRAAAYALENQQSWSNVPCVFLPASLAQPATAVALGMACVERNQPRFFRTITVDDHLETIRTIPIRELEGRQPFANQARLICVVLDDPHRPNTLLSANPVTSIVHGAEIVRSDFAAAFSWVAAHATYAEWVGALLLFGAQHCDPYLILKGGERDELPYQMKIGCVATHWDSYLIRFSKPSMIQLEYTTRRVPIQNASIVGHFMFRFLREYVGLRTQASLQALFSFSCLGYPTQTDLLQGTCGAWDAVFGRYDVFSGDTSIASIPAMDPWTVTTPVVWFRGTSVELPPATAVSALKTISRDRTSLLVYRGRHFNGWKLDTALLFARLAVAKYRVASLAVRCTASTIYYHSSPTAVQACNPYCIYGLDGTNQIADTVDGPILPTVIPSGPSFWCEPTTYLDHGMAFYLLVAASTWCNVVLHPELFTELGREVVPRGDVGIAPLPGTESFLDDVFS